MKKRLSPDEKFLLEAFRSLNDDSKTQAMRLVIDVKIASLTTKTRKKETTPLEKIFPESQPKRKYTKRTKAKKKKRHSNKMQPTTVDGESFRSFAAACKHYEVHPKVVRKKIDEGMSVDDAFGVTPKRAPRRKVVG